MYELSHGPEVAIESPVVVWRKDYFLLLRDSDKIMDLLSCGCNRFLQDDMFARLKCTLHRSIKLVSAGLQLDDEPDLCIFIMGAILDGNYDLQPA